MKQKSTSEYLRREAKLRKEPSLDTRRTTNRVNEQIKIAKAREKFFSDLEKDSSKD